jgi:hypothetical protein
MPEISLRPFSEDDGPVLMGVLGAPAVARWLLPAGRAQPNSEVECAARASAGTAHWRTRVRPVDRQHAGFPHVLYRVEVG